MAVVKNVGTHPVELTGGAGLGPGESANVDPAAANEAAYIAAGILIVTDGSVPPQPPAQAPSPVVPDFSPFTRYPAGYLIFHGGSLYEANGDFSSAASFDISHWTALIGGPSAGVPSNLLLPGHSYLDPKGIGITRKKLVGAVNQYGTPAKIARALGLQDGQVQYLAVSGAQIRSHLSNGTPRYLQAINPGNSTPWPQVPPVGMTFAWFGANEVGILGTGTLVQNGMVWGYRSLISRTRSFYVADANDITVDATHGTWTWRDYSTLSPAWGSGAGCWESSTVGDYLLINLPTGTGSVVQHVSQIMLALGFVTATTGATFRIDLDGVTIGTIDTFGGNFLSTERGSSVFRLPITPTSAQIKITLTALSSGGPGRFDHWQAEAPTPNLFLMGEMTVPPNPPPLWGNMTPANVDTGNGWLRALVTEFDDPSVDIVNLDTLLGGAVIRANGQGTSPANFRYYECDLTSHGLHPNEDGALLVGGAVAIKVRDKLAKGGLDPSQISAYSTAELPPLTSLENQLYHGSGLPLALLDGFDVPDSNATPAGWTPLMGGWGISQKQLAVVHDQFAYPNVTDTFQRADGPPGSGWSTVAGTWAIASNELKMTAASTPAVPILLASQQLDASGNGGLGFTVGSIREDFAGVVFRYQDASNFWTLYESVSGTSWVLAKRVAGVDTTVQNGSMGSNATGQKLHVECNGTSIKVWNNNVLEKSVTDTDLQTARGIGFRGKVAGSTGGPTFSRFSARAGAMDTTQDPGFNAIVRDLGVADESFQFTVGASGPVNFAGVVFRYTDTANYMTMYQSATFGGWAVYSVIAGVATHVCDCHESNAPGTIVTVKMLGNQFTFLFNAIASAAGTQTVGSAPTGTKAGARLDYQSTVSSTIPNLVLDTAMAGGVAINVPDAASYRDDVTGILYTDYQAGVATDQIPWMPLDGTNVREANTTGLTSAQIDALFVHPPSDGRVLSDPTNHLLLVREGGKWCKTAALTVIA